MSASLNGNGKKKAFSVRKNNMGRALVRFLIGAIIIAALVIMINEFWLKKSDNPADDVTSGVQTAVNSGAETVEGDTTPLDQAGSDETQNTGAQADDNGTENGENEGDTFGDILSNDGGESTEGTEGTEGIEGTEGSEGTDGGDDFEIAVTPTPTAVPTPTPSPAATAVPQEMYASRVTKKDVTGAKWLTDKQTRINNGITDFVVLPSVNSGSVISITGWSYATYNTANRGWDGKHNTTYLYVTNEKKQVSYYAVTTAAGATGMTHTTTGGKNMDMADFTCIIDVSGYPDGTYSIGSCHHFTITHNSKTNHFHHGYTFGDTYNFTVKDGIVTAVGGIENN
ncbi:MAG: hypothetical protein II875_03855 [Clostridia bacterium]|nr:hypothetical protein [Clostridia bacterium]